MNIGEAVLLKNNQFIVINKPPGIPVQPDKTKDKSLLELAQAYTKQKLFLTHRIDRPVSGIVVFAKNKKALAFINEQFKQRKTKKTYWAVVKKGELPNEGKLVHYLLKDQRTNQSKIYEKEITHSKKVTLNYKVLRSSDNYQLLEIQLLSGRHHQIRAQLAFIGFPVKGDVKYGFRRSNKDRSIHLHARVLSFLHPVKKEEVQIVAPLPDDNLWQSFLPD